MRALLMPRRQGVSLMRRFSAQSPMDVKLPPAAIASLKASGITGLMPIQAATIATLRSGVDVIARAKTGSGKTLAFLIPIMEKIASPEFQRSKEPVALIMEPTRELALQVARVVASFGLPVRTCVVYGGESMTRQAKSLRNGCDIIVGTPGRMCDFLDRRWVDLSRVESYVVDEADRLLDMGFEKQLEQISAALPDSRQSIMFSATLPDWTKKLARKQLKSNQEVIDLVQNEQISVPEQVRHIAGLVRSDGRHGAIESAIAGAGGGKALVFAATKIEVDEVARSLPSARALHGGMMQRQRENVLAQFREGRFNVLVATDVASRGLDINDVKTVVHLRPRDFTRHPLFPEDYIHRAGRVGRAGQEGTSVFLYSGREHKMINILERQIGIKFDHHDYSAVERQDTQRGGSRGGPVSEGGDGRGDRSGEYRRPGKRRFLDTNEPPRKQYSDRNSFGENRNPPNRDRDYLNAHYKKRGGNDWKKSSRGRRDGGRNSDAGDTRGGGSSGGGSSSGGGASGARRSFQNFGSERAERNYAARRHD